MSMPVGIPIEVIANIVLEGMKIFREERKHKIHKKYEKALKRLRDAQNKIYPTYSDDDLTLANDELREFLEVYGSEFRAEVVEALSRDKGRQGAS